MLIQKWPEEGDFGETIVFKIAEVAKRLRISLACVYALVESGRLACYRIGVGRGTIRISEEQLQAFLDSAEQDSMAPTTHPRAKDFVFLPPP